MRSIIFLFLLITNLISAQDFLHTEGKYIIDKNGEKIILRGIGLGGYMLQEGYMLKVPFSGQQYVFRNHVEELIGEEATEEFYKRWLSNHVQKPDIDSLKKWGFNSVRLPMHYNLYTLPIEDEPVKGENTWRETGFALTDSLLKWCTDNEMYLILDMHAAPGGQGHDLNISDRDPSKPSLWESKANQEKLIALWEELAKRYKDQPWIGGYDLINEPNWRFSEEGHKHGIDEKNNAPIRKLMIEITKVIREVDQNHIIFIEGNGWGNNYTGILPPWDKNMVVSFHKYWNYNRTKDIEAFLEIRDQYNVPVWLGESGENSNVWFRDAIKLMEENQIGWCWWPLKKLGSNNPLEIKMNEGYLNIINYWKDEAEKPSRDEAIKAFMQLAENTKIKNNIVHYDVLDAMFRQVKTDSTLSFRDHLTGKNIIKAVNYDLGPINKAYYDVDYANYHVSTGGERQPWNKSRLYRNDGVDIFKTQEGELYVGDFVEEEWLLYSIEEEEKQNYNLILSLRSVSEGSVVNVYLNDQLKETLEVEQSDQFQIYKLDEIELNKGLNQLKIAVNSGDIDFKDMKFNVQ
ncbi:cellulase family glycosylhydrolase [Mangrovivirga sp. M17]|uniref:Cellulase family glycosylhydrolase n=1 Tax=Mangrovivirga halotolerans TaxID=2993936 RepID=A0ABT3RWK0_9BACT|nr:cellulase family glycosylhydrolase [Mangrovivirga halotolerans]MCX2746041.1 cellulase family glycosylhydrolase [Mangrovivirga halotolerans]